ncbi:MAG: hypothetical protein EXR77_19180 [Myxococcales bacterium]|nr:hypothetical protein [Myxococcales bacterium]
MTASMRDHGAGRSRYFRRSRAGIGNGLARGIGFSLAVKAARTKQPVHHNLLARALASAHFAFADALRLVGRHATKECDRLAEYLVRAASDPNWKTRPSVLDQLRGWPPPKPKKKPKVGA